MSYYFIRTDLREWKVETRERRWKTGEDRSVVAGAEILTINNQLADISQHNLVLELVAECSMESIENAVAAALEKHISFL